MVQEGNARLARIERHLASMNGSLRNISVCLIVVASIFILGYIVSIVWGISSMQATMRNIDKQINIVQ